MDDAATAVLGEDWTLPGLTDLNREWFTAAALRVQRCSSCGNQQHPPEEICHACGGLAFGFTTLAPTGTVHSYTIAHYAVNRALAAYVPYAVVLVALDDVPNIRVIGNLLEVPSGEVRIGMAVNAIWQDHTNTDGDLVRVPQWVPA